MRTGLGVLLGLSHTVSATFSRKPSLPLRSQKGDILAPIYTPAPFLSQKKNKPSSFCIWHPRISAVVERLTTIIVVGVQNVRGWHVFHLGQVPTLEPITRVQGHTYFLNVAPLIWTQGGTCRGLPSKSSYKPISYVTSYMKISTATGNPSYFHFTNSERFSEKLSHTDDKWCGKIDLWIKIYRISVMPWCKNIWLETNIELL